MQKMIAAFAGALLVFATCASASELSESVKDDYDNYLADLWDHFHRNPELSLVEFRTAERMAQELRDAGYDDGEIVEIISNVALNVLTNFFAKATHVDIDFPEVELLGSAA